MNEIDVTYTMNQHDHFKSQLEILYRALRNSLILAGTVFGLFWIVFFIDYSVNGTMNTWSLTSSLMFIAIVFDAMVLVYVVYSPLHAWLKSCILARAKTPLLPVRTTFAKDKITVETEDGAKRYLSWFELRIFRNTKNFLIVRDRAKKNQTGMLIVPKSALTETEVNSILRYRREVIRKEELKRNPVARERARQNEEREKRRAAAGELSAESQKTEADARQIESQPSDDSPRTGE